MRLALFLTLLGSLSCSHLQPAGGSLEEAQHVTDEFLRQLRWGNLRSASLNVRSSRRHEFQAFVEDGKLDDHLKVTEYEVKDIERGPDGTTATVSGELTWYVEPSVTLVKEKFHLHLAWVAGAWTISWIEGGPLPLAEDSDAGPAPPDAGAAKPAR